MIKNRVSYGIIQRFCKNPNGKEKCTVYNKIGGRIRMSKELTENETFIKGVAVGTALYQNEVISAHKRKKPLIISGNLYYLQDSRERLAEFLEKICR